VFIIWRALDELRREGVSSGDIIRMIIVNLNGTWTITQLLSFRKIMKKSEWESCPEMASAYDRVIFLYKSVGNAKASTSDK